jgi:hypothetical protein
MDNFILDKQTDWRYCRVIAGGKKPYPEEWQKTPLELWQVDSANIGLLLGPASNGICAIDFDGPTAFAWAEAQGINLQDLPITPTWSSGKPGRCQMAFRVPKELWDILYTKKVVTKKPSSIGAGDGEGFEFRWTGGQSVLPPSVHPDTGRPYEWLIDAMEKVADIPDSILIAWANNIAPKREPSTVPEVRVEDLNEKKVAQVNEILEIVKSKNPVLAYDDWCKISWGVAKELGREAGEIIMREYYPEQEPGEYRNIYRTYDVSRSPSMGTVKKVYAGIQSRKDQHAEKYREYLTQQEEIEKLERRIREMKNGKQ